MLTPADVPVDYLRDLGLPGEYPFTRGVQPTMYRSRLWTMRMFAGFGTPEQTNARFKYLLAQGQTGLSTAFDFPTLMGYDSRHARARSARSACAASRSTRCATWRSSSTDIPLDQVTTSMTINGPAIVLLAFYVALADERGIPRDAHRRHGPERLPQGVHRAARVARAAAPGDAHRHRHDRVLRARGAALEHRVSISGYHIREAGATAAQELAFTLADGIALRAERASSAGLRRRRLRAAPLVLLRRAQRLLRGDRQVPRRAAHVGAHHEGALRREEAPESMKLRTHAQTAGVSLTAQQPYNNVVRVALQALAAVLGGTQSLHTNSLDETYALPTEDAVTIALRTQQIIAEESGVASTIDPLGGIVLRRGPDRQRLEAEARAVHPPHRRDGRHGRARSRRATRSARSPRAPTASSASSRRASA